MPTWGSLLVDPFAGELNGFGEVLAEVFLHLRGFPPRMKPKVDPDKTGSGPDEAQCSLTSGDGDAAISDHTLDMSASLHDSRGTADAVYKRLQGEEQWGNEAVSGPWEEAILGSDDDTYALIVRDENAVVIVYQGVDPFDGLKADAAEELMTAYAQQILEYLHE